MSKDRIDELAEKLEKLNMIVGKSANTLTALSLISKSESKMPGECDKHTDCMERIHESINLIKQENAKTQGMMEGFTDSVNEFITAIRRDVYSPNGLIEKVGKNTFQVGLQWGALGAILIIIIGGWIKLAFSR